MNNRATSHCAGLPASKTATAISGGETRMKPKSTFRKITMNRLAVPLIALGMATGSVMPAWATIDNTVTVTGSSPGNTDDVKASDTENVDVQDAAPVLTVTKVATFGAGPATADGTTDNVAAGTVITYTYTVTNSGNVGVTNVSLSDDHNTDADGSLGTITLGALTDNGGGSSDDAADNDYDYLGPGDMVTWTATYTVTVVDIAAQSADADGNLDNTVTASAGYTNSSGSPATVTGTASEEVDLEDANPSLQVAKAADDTTDVTVGQLITYTYTVTNNGNVPINNISLSDAHGGTGTAPSPDADGATLTDNSGGQSTNSTTGDGKWDVLAPGDVLTMTATYTVTQADVDAQ